MQIRMAIACLALAFLAQYGAPSRASAKVLVATPSNWKTQYSAARPGDTLKFMGTFSSRTDFSPREFSPSLTIDATGAVFNDSVSFKDVHGILIYGGIYGNPTGNTALNRAIVFFGGSNIKVDRVRVVGSRIGQGVWFSDLTDSSVTNSSFSNLGLGVMLLRSRRIRILNNHFMGSSSDGINIVSSHNVIASYNFCEGTQINDGAHPDCIQMWSLVENPVQSDIEISYNTVTGATQGFTSFDPLRGGLLRANIHHNRVDTSYPQGIACYNCVDSIVAYNQVTTMPGAKWQTTINVVGGNNVKTVGNTIGPKSHGKKWTAAMPMKMPGSSIVGYSPPSQFALGESQYWPDFER